MKTQYLPSEINEALIVNALEITQSTYRKLDPGWYLYRKLLEYSDAQKFKTEFIELVYVTLSAWNMNSRAAKLQDFDLFEKSIVQNKKQLIALFDKTIFDLNKVELKDEIYFLFNSLDLVHIGKPPLVTFSKTMHFFLPKLISPIDRRYTLTYFYNNVNVPNTIEKQFAKFWAIQQKYLGIATEYNLSNFVDNKWNSTIPKVVDNIIIGICKIKEGLKTKTIEEI